MEIYIYNCLWCALSQSINCQPEIKPAWSCFASGECEFLEILFFYLYGTVSTKAVSIMDYYLDTHLILYFLVITDRGLSIALLNAILVNVGHSILTVFLMQTIQYHKNIYTWYTQYYVTRRLELL